MKIYVVLCALLALVIQLANAQTVNRNDVIIDEIMADPSPPVGLPDVEWIELRNTTSFNINLSGWRIAKSTSQSGALPNFILQPDSFVIVCTAGAVSAMSAFGPVISVTGFPSLANDADLVYLRSNDNRIISAVNYSDAWYKNELKRAGGWTLEMTDSKNSCSGSSNWKAAIDNKGGTPGKINSTDAANPDAAAPVLRSAFASDSLTITLLFDEPLDSLKAATANNYSVSDGIGIPLMATAIPPLFDKVNLTLTSALLPDKVYVVTANAVADCSANIIGLYNTAKAGVPSLADKMDIVINEILFNPPADGVDYVEVYNRSTKIIDCKQLYIASRNATGVISSIQQLSAESLLIFPKDFIVVSEDPSIVKAKYITTNLNAFVQLPAMPSFADDKGDVVILNAQGQVIDEVVYSAKWQFELITNPEGVSLERIDYNAPSVQANFHSAATSVGYGTPGYKNSQYRIEVKLPGNITVTPPIISPDNDGTDDFATVNYNFPAPGYVANITVFDASGRPVRYLQRNALCGINGHFTWDGLNEKHQKLSQGIYIFFTEVFNTAGSKKQFKNTIVLATKVL